METRINEQYSPKEKRKVDRINSRLLSMRAKKLEEDLSIVRLDEAFKKSKLTEILSNIKINEQKYKKMHDRLASIESSYETFSRDFNHFKEFSKKFFP